MSLMNLGEISFWNRVVEGLLEEVLKQPDPAAKQVLFGIASALKSAIEIELENRRDANREMLNEESIT
jgi:hypothetical protein